MRHGQEAWMRAMQKSHESDEWMRGMEMRHRPEASAEGRARVYAERWLCTSLCQDTVLTEICSELREAPFIHPNTMV
jgi:hypothetical protein